ncbi:hypothetical protein A1Q2_01795 [Trichosporon asahii var. asahii CBS 8904]|uniref:Uridylate kinase n=2 Tax=Trichosporon asahii var. asahii TaxID=189963 RepID=K1VWG2_TRIAC|nr:hypothetical protein A1Q1_04436 [Trichosporon asahii var. asahii CBS 2479]EJT46835.1 hypothetical protein A1Q1_04436 [Trichosporon asahii var. asahii CBS 2479]EKD03782.1 hypothetical protein A1Q2_01795 [Trichosporon asahii var. asahii CBS 8904]
MSNVQVPKAEDLWKGDKPVFDPSKVTVVFVLGGPGAGKGTQCALMVKDYGFVHLSAGDLLRAEQERPGSQYGDLIRHYIKEGLIVPMEITIKLLENAMADAMANPPKLTDPKLEAGWENGKGRFLIDGFPRKMDQALMFDKVVCPSAFVLFINTDEDKMTQRIIERSKTSGRDDDNLESLKKRFKTFRETSMPVVDMYRKEGKVADIDSSVPIPQVYEQVKAALNKHLSF